MQRDSSIYTNQVVSTNYQLSYQEHQPCGVLTTKQSRLSPTRQVTFTAKERPLDGKISPKTDFQLLQVIQFYSLQKYWFHNLIYYLKNCK